MKLMSDTSNTNQNNDAGIFTPLSFSDSATNNEAVSSGGVAPVSTQNPTVAPPQNNSIPKDEKTDEIVSAVPGEGENNWIDVTKSDVSEEDTKKEVTSMGVTFVDEAPEEKQEKNIFSKDSSFKEKEMQDLGMNNSSETDTQKTQQKVETKDLEADFSKTFNSPIVASGDINEQDPIALEETKLRNLHKELKDKAGAKKVVVKERLEKLRQEKESLGKELEEIKELEAIALKIEEKLKSLETIDSEIDSLEAKAREELQ